MGRYGVHTLAKKPHDCAEVPGIVIRSCADDPHAPHTAAGRLHVEAWNQYGM